MPPSPPGHYQTTLERALVLAGRCQATLERAQATLERSRVTPACSQTCLEVTSANDATLPGHPRAHQAIVQVTLE